MPISKEELGKLVKHARDLKSEKIGKKYSQASLAIDIKKSQGLIGDIEAGRTYPSSSVLLSIANACEVPMSMFDEYKEIIEKDDFSKIVDPEIRAIARDVSKLKPEKKELFKNLLKQMSDEANEASEK